MTAESAINRWRISIHGSAKMSIQQNCQQPKKLVPVEVPVIPRETVIILAEFPKKPKTCSRWLRTHPTTAKCDQKTIKKVPVKVPVNG
jgi:xanthine/CO dehydrogenase XdhC/CoxF family maturation factor